MTQQSKAYYAAGAVGQMGDVERRAGARAIDWSHAKNDVTFLMEGVTEGWIDRMVVLWTKGMCSVCLCGWPWASFDEDQGDTCAMPATLPGFQICICKIAVWQAVPETENSLS